MWYVWTFNSAKSALKLTYGPCCFRIPPGKCETREGKACLHLTYGSKIPLSSIPFMFLVMPLMSMCVVCIVFCCMHFSSRSHVTNAFLANVNSSSCWICRLPVVCRLSVTFVHPTQAIEIFRNISTPCGTLANHDLCIKILRRSSQGSPSVGGVKHKRGSRI